MSAAVFIMAILGCGEADLPCDQVRVVETRYASEAECLARSDAMVLTALDVDYPVVVAQCRPALSPEKVRIAARDTGKPGPRRNGRP